MSVVSYDLSIQSRLCFERALEQTRRFHALRERGKCAGRAAPPQLVDIAKQRCFSPQCRKIFEHQRGVTMVSQYLWRKVLDRAVPVQEARRRHRADPRNAWISICHVADEGEVIGNQDRVHSELLANAFSIADLVPSAVDLYYAVTPDALRQILVGCPDTNLFHARIFRGDPRGGGKRVVGLELDHGPDSDAHRSERVLQRVELREKRRLDALARLVISPDVIAKRLDDVIGGDPDVRRSLLDHLQHGLQHADHGAERPVLAFVEATQAVEVPEQLVGTVYEVDDHASLCRGPPPRRTNARLATACVCYSE